MGITRKLTSNELPADIIQVHVPVMTLENPVPTHYKKINKESGKVSLKIYREISEKVMKIVKEFDDGFEKASIDEAYLDITKCVQEKIYKEHPDIYIQDYDLGTHGNLGKLYTVGIDNMLNENNSKSVTQESGIKIIWSDCELSSMIPQKIKISYGYDNLMIKYGYEIAKSLKTRIYDETKMVVSVGVSHNKLVSKLISGKYKPDHCSFIQQDQIKEFIGEWNIKDIYGFGGKLGDSVQEGFGITCANEFTRFSKSEIYSKLGQHQGDYVYDKLLGICHEPVIKKKHQESIQAYKKFRIPLKEGLLQRWIFLLCGEVLERCQEEYEESKNYPTWLKIICTNQNRNQKKFPFPRLAKSSSELFHVVENWIKGIKNVIFVGVVCDGMVPLKPSVMDYFPVKAKGLMASNAEDSIYISKQSINYKLSVQQSIPKKTKLQIPNAVPPESKDEEKANSKNQTQHLLSILDELGKPIYHKCLECGKIILYEDKQSHSDFHFAKNLSRMDTPLRHKMLKPAKANNKSTKSKNSIISEFFKKK
jgi:nucleotidyltransferase/DNA polymerase involved in DNA repair